MTESRRDGGCRRRTTTVLLAGLLLAAGGAAAQDQGNTDPFDSPSQFTVFPVNQLSVFTTNWAQGRMTQVNLTLATPEQPNLGQWNQTIAAQYGGTLPGTPNLFGGLGGRVVTPQRDAVLVSSSYSSESGKAAPSPLRESLALSPATATYGWSPPAGTVYSTLATTTALVDATLGTESQLQQRLVTAQLAVGSPSTLRIEVVDAGLALVAGGSFQVTAATGSRLGLDAGDVDGDGLEEIVVTYQQDAGHFAVAVYQLDTSGASPALVAVSTLSVPAANETVRDVAVGDYDYDYSAEIAVLSIASGTDFKGPAKMRGFYLTGSRQVAQVGQSADLAVTALVAPNADLEAALMVLEPNVANPLVGRQTVTGVVNDDGHLALLVHKLVIDRQGNRFTAQQLGRWSGAFAGFNPGRSTHGPFVAAGNFRGTAGIETRTDPTMQVAVAAAVPQGLNPDTTAAPQLYVFDNQAGALTPATPTPIAIALGDGIQTVDGIAVYPADFDGKSLYLGTPVHLSIEQLVDPRYIIQSPPKHVDFLPRDPSDPEAWNDQSQWEVVNVSAFPSFYVELQTSQTGTVSTSSKDVTATETSSSTTWDVGGSLGFEFAGFDPFKLTAGYKNVVTETATNTQTLQDYSSDVYTTTLSCQTSYWDQLVGYHRSLDIWRYPVYQLPGEPTNPAAPYPYLEILVPGPVSSGPNDQQDGIAVSWYQPTPIINDLISYPRSLGTPVDMGEYTWIDEDGKEHTVTGWLGQWTNSVFGNAKTVTLSWSQQAGSSSEKSYATSYAKSQELKVGFSAGRKFGFVDMQASAGVSFNWTDKSSWSHSDLSGADLKQSTGITLRIPSGNVTGANGYSIETGAYVTQHGELKVMHAASIPDTSRPWWYPRYGTRPDPGLNLPKRLLSDGGNQWRVEADPNQWQQMRLFTVQYAEPNPLTGELEYVGTGIVEGDELLLTAGVYNLSIGQPVDHLEVLFQAQQMTADGQTKIGAPVTIGTVTLPRLDAQGFANAQIAWRVSGWANKFLRLYVTLDPNDAVPNEVHELGAIASNNVGYYPAGTAFPVFAAEERVMLPAGADVSAGSEALAVVPRGATPLTGSAVLEAERLHQVVARFHSTHAARQHRIVEFYEGDPEAGGRMFGSTLLHGVVAGENTVVTDWLPRDPAVGELWFRVLESAGESRRGNARDGLRVTVRPAVP